MNDNTNNGKDINLVDYLNKIIKIRRKLLFSFIICGLFGLAITNWLPATKRGETIIQIGYFYNPNPTIIEAPSQVVMKAENGIYGDYKELVFDSSDFGLMKISLNSDDSSEKITKILSDTNEIILTNHNQLLKIQLDIIDKKIENFNKIMAKLKNKQINLPISYFQEDAFIFLNILDLQLNKNNSFPTKIIKEPTVYMGQRGSSVFVINFILGGILGIILILIYYSLNDWWQGNKDKIKI